MISLDTTIRKYVLKNAYDYGKANAGAVVGKVIAELPECKKDMKGTMSKINAEIMRTSKLKKSEIEAEMAGFEYQEKKEEKKGIEVEGAEQGKVVVRFPPEPNGWPHIGHGKAFCLSWTIARNYGGKVILRWDDTNPEAERQEYLDAIRNGIKWLGLDWDAEKYCSDYLPQMYVLCEKLMNNGDGYACSCNQDAISKGREGQVRCACGSKSAAQNLKDWKKMFDVHTPEGSMIIRLKGDMASQNTVMRDPTLFRIIDTPHYRQGKKYRVWPTYDFQGAVLDSILGITHPIRSKEYELRDELYSYLLKRLGLKIPTMISISRLTIKHAPVSKRLLRPLVESGKLWGWDDPRLPTLAGLKRRGILPQAIRAFVLSFGISKVESEPDWEALLVQNRKLLDPQAPHYFFVGDPISITVKGLKPGVQELKLHPKHGVSGGAGIGSGLRNVPFGPNLYISRADAKTLAVGEVFRLKDLCNVKLLKAGNELIGELAPDSMVEKKVQWVGDKKLDCEVFVPGNLLDDKDEFNESSFSLVRGYCEPACAGIAVGTVVQFERFGFCMLDADAKSSASSSLKFIFTC